MQTIAPLKWMPAAVAIACLAFAPDVKACSYSLTGQSLTARGLGPELASAADLAKSPTGTSESPQKQATFVGMWIVDLNLSTGELADRAIQQVHVDGNEMMNSSGSPPVTGNVCFGVWRAAGPGTFELRHISWAFDADGTFVGTGRLFANITVDPSGDTYTGDFESDLLDLSGKHVPGSTVKGTMKASRFKPI